MRKKVNEISSHLYKLDIDCLGISEANLKKGAKLEDVEIATG